ncbi:MAG: outer membrane beta-barrel protein [Bacteroidota bacterium]
MNILKFSTIMIFLLFGKLFSQESSMYLGGSMGTSFVNHTLSAAIDEATTDDLTIDKNNFSYKIFAGYRANKFLSFEGGYRNTGKAEDRVLGYVISTTTKGWDIAAVGTLDLEIVFAFLKAGVFFWNTENSLGTELYKENNKSFLWGIGAGVKLGGIAVRLEWESLGTDNPESLSMLTGGVTFGF